MILVITKGDEADCMYIIYQGEVGIFGDVECTFMFATCKPNQVIGEKALENDNKRGASIKALKDCKMLRLKKLHYKSIVLVSQNSLLILTFMWHQLTFNIGLDIDAEICCFGILKDCQSTEDMVLD
jgi:CRP-like cAMP-binding protein